MHVHVYDCIFMCTFVYDMYRCDISEVSTTTQSMCMRVCGELVFFNTIFNRRLHMVTPGQYIY